MFDFVAGGQWVLLLDEFDAIARARDSHDDHRVSSSAWSRPFFNSSMIIQVLPLNYGVPRITMVSLTLPSGAGSTIVFLPLPDLEARRNLLALYLRSFRYDDVNLDKLARETSGSSGGNIIGSHRCDTGGGIGTELHGPRSRP